MICRASAARPSEAYAAPSHRSLSAVPGPTYLSRSATASAVLPNNPSARPRKRNVDGNESMARARWNVLSAWIESPAHASPSPIWARSRDETGLSSRAREKSSTASLGRPAHVCSGIDLVTAGTLFWAHVNRRSYGEPRFSQPGATCLVERSRETKIGHDGGSLGEKDFLGFDIAMQDVAPVRICQRLCHVPGDAHRVGYRKLVLARQAIAERFTFDEGHHVVQQIVAGAGVVERQDMGVRQLGGDLDFVKKPFLAASNDSTERRWRTLSGFDAYWLSGAAEDLSRRPARHCARIG